MPQPLPAPQLVVNSRMVYTSWIPADLDACARLLPKKLSPAADGAVYMNQYVVDSAEQTTGFGAYSLTYLGLNLADLKAPDGVTPARFFTHYLNSSEVMRAYVSERGVPAAPGRTTVEAADGVVTATTYDGDTPIIRTRATFGAGMVVAAGHLRYVTRVENRLVAGNYPYVGELTTPFQVTSLEFLEPGHPVYALRPAEPLRVVAESSFYAPRDSFVYPGGEEDIGPAGG